MIVFILLGLQSRGYAGLEISTDKRVVSFGLMHLDEEKELAQYGGYQNEIICRSTNGNTWHLKISLLRPLASIQDSIPLECFKWQLVWKDGNGIAAYPYEFKEFSLFPELVYTSAPQEDNGKLVRLQFKYYLRIPEAQTRGSYNTVIRFTISEVL